MTTAPARGSGTARASHPVRTFADDPLRFFDGDRTAMHRLPATELTRLQLAALRLRFEELRDALPVVHTMAEEQRIDSVDRLDDVAGLLFPHTVYKSYPSSLLTGGRFDALTSWLSRLTTVDLSGLDTSRCTSVDEWLALVDSSTRLRLAHSSGTSGTLSFVPHTAEQYALLYEMVRHDTVPQVPHEEPVHVVWPSYRTGRSGIARHATAMAEQIARTDDHFHALSPGHFSADLMVLAGRLRAAAATGRPGQVEIPAPLLDRKAELEEIRRDSAGAMRRFTARLAEELRGERVVSLSLWDTYYEMARAGLDQDIAGVFHPASVIMPGGGTKGSVLPDDWDHQVARFAGVPQVRLCYAMTEIIALQLICPAGAYHVEPWVVPYVLDEITGQPLPRRGVAEGRAAFFDLTADVHWGGVVTGDRVTVTWDPCPCGMTTPRIARQIGRFSDGDDKITCAATPQALDDALDFLNETLL